MATRAWLAHDDAGAGSAVVLIHGHPFDRAVWERQVGPLGERFRVIAPDLRGYGHSPAVSGTATMGELALDVWGLLDDLGVERVAAVGLSMGGLVAIEMALARPRSIWALGLVGTGPGEADAVERRTRMALADRVEAVGMQALVESIGPRLLGRAADPALIARVLAMMRAANPVGAAAALRGRAQRPDYRAALRELDVPAFVCAGSEDAHVTAADVEELAGELRAASVLTIAGAGHLPNLEAPRRFNDALIAFLESADGRR